jgi:hypothetical protein
VNKFSIPYSAFTILIITMMVISYPIFNSGSSLLFDIPKATAFSAEQKEQQDGPPFLLPTPSLSPSTSKPFGTITGSEMGMNKQQEQQQTSSSSSNNPSMQSNLVGTQAATTTRATTEKIPNQYIVVLKPSSSHICTIRINGCRI